jgi:hypothetical protein
MGENWAKSSPTASGWGSEFQARISLRGLRLDAAAGVQKSGSSDGVRPRLPVTCGRQTYAWRRVVRRSTRPLNSLRPKRLRHLKPLSSSKAGAPGAGGSGGGGTGQQLSAFRALFSSLAAASPQGDKRDGAGQAVSPLTALGQSLARPGASGVMHSSWLCWPLFLSKEFQ